MQQEQPQQKTRSSATHLDTPPPSPSPPSSSVDSSPSSISSLPHCYSSNMGSNSTVKESQTKNTETQELPKKPDKNKHEVGMVIKLSYTSKDETGTRKSVTTSKEKEHVTEVDRSPQQRAVVPDLGLSPEEVLVLRLGQCRSQDLEPSDSSEWAEGTKRNLLLFDKDSRVAKRKRSRDFSTQS